MTDVSLPRVTVSIANASLEVGNDPQRLLIVGQKLSAGSATSGALVENILDDGSITALSGVGSLAEAYYQAARKLNAVVQFDAIFLDDAGGATESTGSVAFSGTATEAGELTVFIGSERNRIYSLAVSDADTATVIGDALVAAITTDTESLVTAINTTGTVALTAKNGGTLGNTIGIKTSGTIAGITVASVAMSSGATDPTLTDIFDVVGTNRYQGIVWPYPSTVGLNELTGFLDPRFNADNAILDGAGFVGTVDTLSNTLTVGNAENSENLVIFGDKLESTSTHKGPAQLELPAVRAAEFASIRALRLTEDASVSQFVITANGALDAFGGPALASKPYFNTPFPDLPIIETGLGWSVIEVSQLKTAGISVIGNNQAKTESVTGEVVTTYKTDAAGNPDATFQFLNYRDTASSSREYFFNNLKSRFAQTRLTEGDVIRGRDMANALTIRTFIEKLYQDLSDADFVLVQAGEDAIQFFKDSIVIVLDLVAGSATIQMETPIVTQLREIIVTQKISFTVGE